MIEESRRLEQQLDEMGEEECHVCRLEVSRNQKVGWVKSSAMFT